MNKTFYQFLFFSLAFFFTFTPITIEAQSTDNKQPVKYKKARALQSSTAKKMAKVYEALEEVDEKGEPAPNMETVLSILNDLRDNRDDLKSYDRSVMWNAWAYVYFSEGQYSQALDSYRKLMNEPESTIPLRTGALLSMGQLSMVQENYDQGIKYILQWMDEVEKVTAQAWSFFRTSILCKRRL
jgi:tetratricopeptide (TPR) repeat protein